MLCLCTFVCSVVLYVMVVASFMRVPCFLFDLLCVHSGRWLLFVLLLLCVSYRVFFCLCVIVVLMCFCCFCL